MLEFVPFVKAINKLQRKNDELREENASLKVQLTNKDRETVLWKKDVQTYANEASLSKERYHKLLLSDNKEVEGLTEEISRLKEGNDLLVSMNDKQCRTFSLASGEISKLKEEIKKKDKEICDLLYRVHRHAIVSGDKKEIKQLDSKVAALIEQLSEKDREIDRLKDLARGRWDRMWAENGRFWVAHKEIKKLKADITILVAAVKAPKTGSYPDWSWG